MALSRQKRQVPGKERAPSAPGAVLSFVGSKGGVGTSTTAVNIAALLAPNGLAPVGIELQQGRPGTLSLYSQAEPSHSLNSLLKKPADTIHPSHPPTFLVEALPRLFLLFPPA